MSGISSFPYNEGFENTIGAWSQSTADDLNWTVDASGTPSRDTGPSSATQGSFYIFVEASGNGTGFPNKQAIITSPCFDLSGLSAATFSFSYHMFGANDMGSIALEVSDDNGSSWTSVWSETGNKGNSWLNASVDLASYVGGGIQVRFNRITGGTWQADIAIDNVSLSSGGGTSTPPADICAGVAEYDSSRAYSAGDQVTFRGSLYERTTTGWINLGTCGSTTAAVAGTFVDLNDFDTSLAITLYPNPAKNNLFIASANTNAKAYSIFNTLGQLVDEGNAENTIDVSQLQNGLYTIVINGQTQRFIKN